jgi:hypothetical protein
VTAIACDLAAFDAAERRRYDELRARLSGLRTGIREAPDGYTLLYPADDAMLRSLTDWIALERRCCPFLRFVVEVPPNAGGIAVTLAGDAAVKDFLREALGAS